MSFSETRFFCIVTESLCWHWLIRQTLLSLREANPNSVKLPLRKKQFKKTHAIQKICHNSIKNQALCPLIFPAMDSHAQTTSTRIGFSPREIIVKKMMKQSLAVLIYLLFIFHFSIALRTDDHNWLTWAKVMESHTIWKQPLGGGLVEGSICIESWSLKKIHSCWGTYWGSRGHYTRISWLGNME